MVIDLTNNNSTAAIKNIDEDLALSYYSKLGLEVRKQLEILPIEIRRANV